MQLIVNIKIKIKDFFQAHQGYKKEYEFDFSFLKFNDIIFNLKRRNLVPLVFGGKNS